MKVTEELLNKMKQDSNFSDGIILPDGDYRLIQDGGHMEALMGLLPYTSDEIFKMVPQDDSPLFWLIEKTGCVITDYNSTVGMDMTHEQERVFQALVAHGFISSEYFNLSSQRKKFHDQEKQKDKTVPSL